MDLIIYVWEGGALMESVAHFKNLWLTLDQSDNNWPEIFQSIGKVWKVWGCLGKIFQREGGDTQVLDTFYCYVVKLLLLFVSELWSMSEVMKRTIEGTSPEDNG